MYRSGAIFGGFALVSLTILSHSGCRTFHTVPSLPIRHSIVREQLVIYSDFPITPRHRLFNELAAQREAAYELLELPSSEAPIDIYLFGTADGLRAFIRERFSDFPDRRAFFVEAEGRLSVYAYWGERVAEDLRHEVAHGYLHAVIPDLPLWLDEGLAEYFEVPLGQHGQNRAHLSLLIGEMEREAWKPDLSRLESITSAADLTQIDYAEAWAWVHFLLESADHRRQLLLAYLANLRRDRTAPPLSEYLGAEQIQQQGVLVQYIVSVAGPPGR